jgi:hypothetical protein
MAAKKLLKLHCFVDVSSSTYNPFIYRLPSIQVLLSINPLLLSHLHYMPYLSKSGLLKV